MSVAIRAIGNIRYSTRRSCAGWMAGGEGEISSAPWTVW